tara:strand:- start:537 stop:896 length:360 start_codon:yes stop_codon:yes gene_type:complete
VLRRGTPADLAGSDHAECRLPCDRIGHRLRCARATILAGKHRNKRPRISVGAVGLGITSAVVVMFSLGVFIAPGDPPRLAYIYFAGGMWIIVSAGFLVTGLIAAIHRERRIYSADGHAP